MKNSLKTILIIDDEKPLLEFLRHVLTRAGYNVLTSESAEHAYTLLNQPIDLILCDYILPKETGADFLKKINGELKLKIPVIIVSGFAPSPFELLPLGAKNVVSKPIQTKHLIKVIENSLLNDLTTKWNKKPIEDIVYSIKIPSPESNTIIWGHGGFHIPSTDFYEKDSLMGFKIDLDLGTIEGVGRILWTPNIELKLGVGVEIIYITDDSIPIFKKLEQKLSTIATIPLLT